VGNFESLPITIVSQVGSTVTFTVEQAWKENGSIDAISTLYETINGTLACESARDISEKAGNYTAVCIDGVSQVSLFIEDSTFSGLVDILGKIPEQCGLSTVQDNKAMFHITLPYDVTYAEFCEEQTLCPQTEEPTSGPTFTPSSSPTTSPTSVPTWTTTDEPICVQEARLDDDTTE